MKKFIVIVLLIIVIYYFRNEIINFLEETGILPTRKYIFPVQGKITSYYGNRIIDGKLDFHNGIDIAAAKGTKIINPADGIVKDVYSNAQGGNQVIIEHTKGITTGYAHLNTVAVIKGQRIVEGEIIGTVGTTGITTGPHLHFTVTNTSGMKIDPLVLFVF